MTDDDECNFLDSQHAGGVVPDSMPSLTIAAGKRCVSVGLGFEDMRSSGIRVMKCRVRQELGMVAFRWLVGGKAKAQWVRGCCMPSPPCFFRIYTCISAFCLDETG